MEIPSDTESGALPAHTEAPKIRLQRFLASCGLGSRRACEEFITQGRVTVDGVTVTELGTTVSPSSQKILLDGERLRMERKKYFLFNKPTGVLCTNSDPKRRPRVIDYFPDAGPRLFTVGRLDEDSEGLLLVTNDGDLAQRMAHPRYRIYRTYSVQVAGFPTREIFDQLKKGVYFPEGRFKVLEIHSVRRQGQSQWLEVVLAEGHNREIRRLFARMGHKVMRLERIAFGPLSLGKLKRGEFRELRHEELERLHAVLEKAQSEARTRRPAGKGRPARPKSGGPPVRGGQMAHSSRDDGLIEESDVMETAYGGGDYPDLDAPASQHPALPSRPRSPRPDAERRIPRDRPPGRERPPAGERGPSRGRSLQRPPAGEAGEINPKRSSRPGKRFPGSRDTEVTGRFAKPGKRLPGKRPPDKRLPDRGPVGEARPFDRAPQKNQGEAQPAGEVAQTPRPRRDQKSTGGNKKFRGAADRRFSGRPSSGEAKRRPARKKKPRRGEGRN